MIDGNYVSFYCSVAYEYACRMKDLLFRRTSPCLFEASMLRLSHEFSDYTTHPFLLMVGQHSQCWKNDEERLLRPVSRARASSDNSPVSDLKEPPSLGSWKPRRFAVLGVEPHALLPNQSPIPPVKP
jgi:hypothetical protein